MDISYAQSLRDELTKQGVQLIAVSKTKPVEMIQALYDVGFRAFGENRVQELVEKHETLNKDIEWHMIGNLQSNKVKYIAPFVSLIHSVSSHKLLNTINKEGAKIDRSIPILLQLKIAKEEAKSGLDEQEITELITAISEGQYPHVDLRGLMGMATFSDSEEVVRSEFAYLKSVSDRILDAQCSSMRRNWILSMGMSGDYEIAVTEGSNMVRIGSLLFGKRN